MFDMKRWPAPLRWALVILLPVVGIRYNHAIDALVPEWVKGILFFGMLGYLALYLIWDTIRERRELRELHARLSVRKEAFARFKEKKARVSGGTPIPPEA
jgi:hypothetical protein